MRPDGRQGIVCLEAFVLRTRNFASNIGREVGYLEQSRQPACFSSIVCVCLVRPYNANLSNPPLARWANVLALPCRGVSEGRQAVERIAQQLVAVGCELGARRSVYGFCS